MGRRWALIFPLLVGLGIPGVAAANDEVIVNFKSTVSASQQKDARSDADAHLTERLLLDDTQVVTADSGNTVADVVEKLESDPRVEFAEPNSQLTAFTNPNDLYFSQLWGLNNTGQSILGVLGNNDADIDGPEAWEYSTGSGATVGIVDTGVNPVADLAGQVLPGVNFTGGSSSDTSDGNGHGTHVAGTIAALRDNSAGIDGVAPDAKILPLKVLGSNGSGSLSDVANAFAYAGQHGVPVVNASLGGDGWSNTLAASVANYPNTLYVVAAGNSAHNLDTWPIPTIPCELSSTNLICVAASTQSDGDAYFSNIGTTSVDLHAPGTSILSTYGNGTYQYLNGTSMATPHVAGTAALLAALSQNPTTAQIRAALLNNVDLKAVLNGTTATNGRLNAAAALASLAPDSAPDNDGNTNPDPGPSDPPPSPPADDPPADNPPADPAPEDPPVDDPPADDPGSNPGDDDPPTDTPPVEASTITVVSATKLASTSRPLRINFTSSDDQLATLTVFQRRCNRHGCRLREIGTRDYDVEEGTGTVRFNGRFDDDSSLRSGSYSFSLTPTDESSATSSSTVTRKFVFRSRTSIARAAHR